MAQRAKKFFTPEEYLALEEHSEEKHEYRDGEIIALAGSPSITTRSPST